MAKTKAERAAMKRERQRLATAPSEFVLASLDDGEPITIDVEAAEGEDKDPTFEMVAYNGGPLRVGGYYYPVVVALDSLKGTARRRPILMNHDHSQPVGHTTAIQNDGKSLRETGVLSMPGEMRDTLVQSSSKGFPWQASIGVSAVGGKTEFVEEKKTVQVNGRNVKGPVYVLRGGTLRETTICPIGADDTTRTSIAAQLSEENDMSPELKQFIEASGTDVESLTDDQVTAFEAAYKVHTAGQQATPQNTTDSTPGATDVNGTLTAELADIKAALAADRREREIQARLAGHKLTDEKRSEILASATENNWSADKVELEAVRASRPTVGPAIHSHSSSDVDASQKIAAGLMQAAGISDEMIVADFGEKVVEAANRERMSSLSLKGVFAEYARAHGKFVRDINDDGIREVFQVDRDVQASGFSTLSLSGIVGAVANKSLLQAYQQAEITCTQWCSTSPVSNFQTHTRYRMTQDGNLAEVGAGGEIKHTTLSEASYTNAADTHALMISLTRKMIRNDDLGAFTQINTDMGYAAAHALEQAAVKALTGASTGSGTSDFFSSSSSKTSGQNYFTGAASALDVEALTTAVTYFRKRTNSAGNPLMIPPALLLVPPELETMASQLFGTLPTNLASGTDATITGFAQNPHVGKYTPIVVDYLANAGGYSSGSPSATAWYLFANPNRVSVLDIAFLDGRQTPTIESSEADFNTLGMQFRCYFDFGVATQDDVGAVKSAGA